VNPSLLKPILVKQTSKKHINKSKSLKKVSINEQLPEGNFSLKLSEPIRSLAFQSMTRSHSYIQIDPPKPNYYQNNSMIQSSQASSKILNKSQKLTSSKDEKTFLYRYPYENQSFKGLNVPVLL